MRDRERKTETKRATFGFEHSVRETKKNQGHSVQSTQYLGLAVKINWFSNTHEIGREYVFQFSLFPSFLCLLLLQFVC